MPYTFRPALAVRERPRVSVRWALGRPTEDSRERSRLVGQPHFSHTTGHAEGVSPSPRSPGVVMGRALLKHTLAVNVLACPRGGGPMRAMCNHRRSVVIRKNL